MIRKIQDSNVSTRTQKLTDKKMKSLQLRAVMKKFDPVVRPVKQKSPDLR